MRPRKRVAVLDANEVSLETRCFALETWGYHVFPARNAAELERLLETEWIDVVLAVLPRPGHRALLRLAQALSANVLSLDVKANAPECVADLSLEVGAEPVMIRETLRILVCRKRGPKKPDSVREQVLAAARAS